MKPIMAPTMIDSYENKGLRSELNNPIKEWIETAVVLDVLANFHMLRSIENGDLPHPAVLIQQQTRQVFSPAAPIEYFTNDEPTLFFERGDSEEIMPFDDFLGRYKANTREIFIYREQIRNAAEILRCQAVDLEYIVRLHQYSHAVIHLGVCSYEQTEIDKEVPTNWQKFINERNRFYSSLDDNSREFLTHLLTWHTLSTIGDPIKVACWQSIFLSLIEKQRKRHMLTSEFLGIKAHYLLYMLYLLRTDSLMESQIKGLSLLDTLKSLLLAEERVGV